MAYTYTPDFTLQRDRVRLEIGDTQFDATGKLWLQDSEITQAGTLEGDDVSVAARCCEFLESRFASRADLTEGRTHIALSQRAKAYHEKAKYLRAQAAINGALPGVGGVSISDKRTNDQDSDRVPPAFWRNMTDNPEAEPLTPGSEQMADPFDQTG